MPLYTFRCSQCGSTATEFRKIANRNDGPECRHGPGAIRMTRIIDAPSVQTDLPGYQSPIDGRWVEGRRARTEDLKRSGCRPWEGMEAERKEAIKRSNEVDHQFERTIESGVAEVYNGMSAESQRALQQL